MVRLRTFEKKFRTVLGSKATWNETMLDNTFRPHTQRWFTDGSKTDEGIGAGVHGPQANISIPLGKYPSIFQAEVFAIDICAEVILQRQPRKQHIVICSDSQAALRAVSSCEINSRLVWECVKRLNALGELNTVQLMWVPGHTGVQGNEDADKLAREAAATRPIGPEPFLAVGPHTIREELRIEERNLIRTHWKNTPGLRQAKELLGSYNPRRSRELITLNKTNLRFITGLLTGHCRLRAHMHTLGISADDSCRYCDRVPETPRHIILECDAVSRRRQTHLGKLWPEASDIHSLQPSKLLGFIRALGLDEVL
ncbi:PREDICTED: uncharacterized protein LOC108364547 [Rhagoletis zephyria]|uniref:uncharacterized protein LOC108364547 n=1 Tax=Rhagoletis zephyria TaxID=28612 RepID=UPI0008112730|nr:PREDICTED: uncharacterized protein LOC108364547 [Rhagoletis zephyria]